MDNGRQCGRIRPNPSREFDIRALCLCSTVSSSFLKVLSTVDLETMSAYLIMLNLSIECFWSSKIQALYRCLWLKIMQPTVLDVECVVPFALFSGIPYTHMQWFSSYTFLE